MIQKVLAIALLVLVSQTACSQSRMTDEQKEAVVTSYNEYKEKLNLSDTQSTKMDEINRQYLKELKGLQNRGDSKLAKYKRFRRINSDRDAKAKKILTPQQFQIYQQHQKEVRVKFRNNRSRG